jgi:hypothetical protein
MAKWRAIIGPRADRSKYRQAAGDDAEGLKGALCPATRDAAVDGEADAAVVGDKVFDVENAAIANALHGSMSASAICVHFVRGHDDPFFGLHQLDILLELLGVAHVTAVPRIVILPAFAPKPVVRASQGLGATVVVLHHGCPIALTASNFLPRRHYPSFGRQAGGGYEHAVEAALFVFRFLQQLARHAVDEMNPSAGGACARVRILDRCSSEFRERVMEVIIALAIYLAVWALVIWGSMYFNQNVV